jgi:hypothetical protein
MSLFIGTIITFMVVLAILNLAQLAIKEGSGAEAFAVVVQLAFAAWGGYLLTIAP